LDHGIAEDGTPYIVMELLEGKDLGQRLRDQPRLPPGEVTIIVIHIAKALARAHERGIVHRDVKPENIFLCDVGGGEIFAKLLDFGIAKGTGAVVAGKTETGTMMGSPSYMSPEQMIATKDVDAKSDLWSLGVVAFECLTGALPFEAETVAGLALVIHNYPPPVPTLLNPALPSAIDAWFARACAKDPKARFDNAKQLADSFAAACSVSTEISIASGPQSMGSTQVGKPISSRRRGATAFDETAFDTASSLQPRPKKSALPIAIVAVVLLLGGGGLFLLRASPKPPPAEPAAQNSAPPVPVPTPTPKVEPVPTPTPTPTVSASVAPAASSAIVFTKAMKQSEKPVSAVVPPPPPAPSVTAAPTVAPKATTSPSDPFGDGRK
ncbi:MAG: serine/threonine-protein kinase, partial [Polyangiales bacterium]